jgi:DNA-binding NtrC family response regulator
MNILIADNEKVQLESLRRGLRSKGCKVYEASCVQEALSYIDDDAINIDLVITDHAIRGLDGIDLLKKIRKQWSNMPVIMMSAYSDKELVINAMKNRCNSFIEKPFTLEHLMKEIERLKLS